MTSQHHSPANKASPVTVSVDELLACRQLAASMRVARKRKVSTERIGEMQSRTLGRGLDFSQLRVYQNGDDIRQIDWNVTARTGKPHTKLFSLEREKPCFVVLDLRPGMFFGTRRAFKSVIAARLAAILAWSAVLANDRVGGLVFSASKHVEIKPETGRRGLMKLFRAISDAFDGGVTTDNPAALPEVVTRLSRLAHTGSTIWFLSDFDGFEDKTKSRFAGLMRHNEVNAIQIADVMESELPPPGEYRLQSANGGLRMDTRGRSMRAVYRSQFLGQQQTLRQCFDHGRHYFTCVYTDDALGEKATAILHHLPQIRGEEYL
ncbi:MAG: DUF58 domain-containing protein [Gammaproteobacteria bacterium]|nr:DUF58 domain-containing protein [Gammaproteobacteria bacterium]